MSLSTDLYNLITALRGPDAENSEVGSHLKHHLTCRLRSIVFGTRSTGGIIPGITILRPLEFSDFLKIKVNIERLIDSNDTKLMHFIAHLCYAIGDVQAHEIWNGYGPQLFELLDDYCSGEWAFWNRPIPKVGVLNHV